MTNAVHRFRL